MKTAIQEAIDFINELNDKDTSEFNYYHSAIIEKLNELLEKEKEQIIGDYFNGKKSGVEIWKNGLPDITAEEYYNQTYNQNK